MKEDENLMKKVIQYIDSIVTTNNPGINTPIPEIHPCQKSSDQIVDDAQDYIELINKLQRHTRCSTSYCLREKKNSEPVCRFGYPKELSGQTYIRDDNHGQPELVSARNDPYINPHNRLQLQGWRANVDLKPVLSIYAALQYISKYASKSEPRSEAFSEIFNKILNSSEPDGSSLSSIQKLLLNSVSERDISVQETCHILLGIPLYHSSRNFITLNLNEEGARWIRGTGCRPNDEDFTKINEAGRTNKSPLKKYWDRPDEFEDISLYKMYLTYKYGNGTWNKSKNESIVRIWPRPSGLRNGNQWEDFCRLKVLLHIPHRSISQLNENNLPWSTIYNQLIDTINNDPLDTLGEPIDNEEEICDDESQDEYVEEDEQEEHRHDWMYLAEMGPNSKIESMTNLGTRDMDRNHDWINESKQNYSITDIATAADFVKEASNKARDDDREEIIDTIDYQSLNENQQKVFKRIETHYNDIIIGKKVEPLRILVMGTAGTGKSYLIKAIREQLCKMAGKERNPILVIAPTGVGG